MRLCRITNNMIIDTDTGISVLELSSNLNEPWCREVGEKTPFVIYFYHEVVFATSDLDECWRTFEEALKYFESEVRLGSRLIDMRDIFKGADFYKMPENVKPVELEVDDGED